MIEILVLLLLTKELGKIAEKKGYKPKKYKGLTIALWFSSEVVFAAVGILLTEVILAIYFFALVGAVIGAIISIVIVNNLKSLVEPEEGAYIPKVRTMRDSFISYGFIIAILGTINVAHVSFQTDDIPAIGLLVITLGLANVLYYVLSERYMKHIHSINFLILGLAGILWFIRDISSIPMLIVDLFVIMLGIEQLYCFLKRRSFLLKIDKVE